MTITTQDVQLVFGGILAGRGTPYEIVSFNPWAAVEIRTTDSDLPGSHGTFAGRDLAGGRRVPLELVILGDTKAHALQLLQALQGAWAPRGDDADLIWQESGTVYLLRGRPRLVDPDVERLAQATVPVTLRFLATEPHIYSADETLVQTDAPTPPEGFTFPLTFPLTFGAAGTGGTLQVDNLGTAPAPWTATIIGPCSEPKLIGPDGTIAYGDDLAAGEILVLDSRNRTVLLGGVSSRYSLLTQFAWFQLPPGPSEVKFSTADNLGSVSLSYRSAWW